MKLKVVEHFNKENGHFIGYELKKKALFFLPWKGIRRYKSEAEMDHDIVWLFSLEGKVKRGHEYD